MNSLDKFFCDLCKEHYEKIFKYIIVKVKSKDISEDIVQEVFIIAYKEKEKLSLYENQKAFLYRVSKNLVNEYLRKENRYKIVELKENDLIENSDIYDLIDKEKDLSVDENKYIEEVIKGLPVDKQKLYRLYYVDKVPMKNIAIDFGISDTTMRMRFVRLRKDIKNRVKKIKFGDI